MVGFWDTAICTAPLPPWHKPPPTNAIGKTPPPPNIFSLLKVPPQDISGKFFVVFVYLVKDMCNAMWTLFVSQRQLQRDLSLCCRRCNEPGKTPFGKEWI